MTRIIKAFTGLIVAVILAVAVFGILPQLGLEGPFKDNPLANIFEGGKNAAANAALDASGLKSKAATALQNNREKIAEKTGMSLDQVDAAIDRLDIESWEATTLPDGVTATGSSSINYGGTDATITTYDDPTVVTVDAYGQSMTLSVPDGAQDYLPYLAYL